jgi:two-component system, LytTR family, response regulator
MKPRVYLVDDEPLALERLARLLQRTGRVDVVGSTTEPEKAVTALAADPVDVCFLDIQMPKLNGFEVLGRLSRQPIVIFTTAHDEYALQAFGVNSVDYLLKPIEPESLDHALDKVERLRGDRSIAQPDITGLIKQLIEAQRSPKPEYPERIASRLGERLLFIDLARVTHFYAEDKLIFAACDGKAYCIDHTIAQLEKNLDPRRFIRIHRGSIVNVEWVLEVASLPGGLLSLRLRDARHTELTVARDRAREFKARMAS